MQNMDGQRCLYPTTYDKLDLRFVLPKIVLPEVVRLIKKHHCKIVNIYIYVLNSKIELKQYLCL